MASGINATTGPGESSGPRLRLRDSGGGFDSALAERVRLYLKVTCLINALLTTVVTILFSSGMDAGVHDITVRQLIIVASVTSANGMAWFLVSKSRPSPFAANLTASCTTLALSALYTYAVTNDPGDLNPSRTVYFLLLIVSAVLTLRSSLIPSRATTTALIGLLAVSFPVYQSRPAATGAGWVFVTWVVVASLVIVAVTTLTSHTIYGLQRKMHAAAQLGRYQIERLLGRGGMGEVYLAKHALLRRLTAIKLLRDGSASDTRDLFRQEVQTASALTHPNTVEIYDYGRTPEGVFYFAMEYVEGATLDDIVNATGAMPAARVIHLLLQAAGSLGEVHERGLVHRDVKPSNLMLCERGGIFDTLKVMDFGLVRDLGDRHQKDDRGLTGTPLYLAPEAILQSDGAVPQSDVYALGATAYFLLTGRPPFADGDLVEILSDHLVTAPPAFECDDPSLGELVLRCLSKEPSDRPSDARELEAELQGCRDFGKWTPRDARTWWAEHREVVDAHHPSVESRDRGRSVLGPVLGGTWRRSRRAHS